MRENGNDKEGQKQKDRGRDGDPVKDRETQAETESGISWRQSPPAMRPCPNCCPSF